MSEQLTKIWLSSPHMSGKESTYVQEAFDTNWIAPLGPHVDAFERDLCDYTGSKAAAALSSGTAALHLGLILLDVQPGDYVLCQSFTFSASANPIRYMGAVPVFIDSDPLTWNMDPEALNDAIQACISTGPGKGLSPKKPKAVIPVHLYGMPAQMDQIQEIAANYDIPVLEDAAEALGSTFDEKPCGTLGDLGVLSFNGNKIITTSGGGALLSNNEAHIAKARYLATQARDPAPHYQHSAVGYNYRMSNVLAGIGRGQMEVLDERVASRRSHFTRYRNLLQHVEGIHFQIEPNAWYFSNHWLTAITLSSENALGIDREMLRKRLESAHIESRPLWKPMHMQPIFEQFPYFGGTCAEHLFRDGLCLPSGSNLTEKEWSRIEEVLHDLFGRP